MPLFDYKCPECGAVREVLVRSSDAPSPFCNHDTVHFVMEKQIGAPAVKKKSWHIEGTQKFGNTSVTFKGNPYILD